MAFAYKRRRPSLVRNFWVYRRLILLAAVLGLLLWFILSNRTPVRIVFPFGLGALESTTGLVILASAAVGAAVTALAFTLYLALHRRRGAPRDEDDRTGADWDDERPPPDYASKTEEGFSSTPWNRGSEHRE